MATAIEQLEAMRGVTENWDGYGAAPPRSDVIDLAQAFVGLMEATRRERSPQNGSLQVCPTRIGGVLIEWESGAMDHEIEFNPDGSISFLHFNRETEQIETSQGAMLSRPFRN